MGTFVRSNLYLDENGNTIKGRFLVRQRRDKYLASFRYPEGYQKAKVFYDVESAKLWLDTNWDTYKDGKYIDEYSGELKFMNITDPKKCPVGYIRHEVF